MDATVLTNYRKIIKSNPSKQTLFARCRCMAVRQKVYHALSSIVTPKPLSGMAAIVVLVLIVVVFFPGKSGIETLIDAQNALLLKRDSLSVKHVAKDMPLPWENTALGFAPAHLETSSLAFAAGIWDVRHALTASENREPPKSLNPNEKKSWNDTDQADFYQYGRWLAILWSRCRLDDAIDWKEQTRILDRLSASVSDLSKADANVVKMLESIKTIKSVVSEISSNGNGNYPLIFQLELTMSQLSPATLNED
ncbi:MAG: hypothetical protein ACU84J_00840 [Gammaproteobacteria bacterium]